MFWGPFLPGWKVDPLSRVFPTGSSDCSYGGWLSFTESDSCGGRGSLTKPYPLLGVGCIQSGGLQCLGSPGITGVSSCRHKKGRHTFLQRACLSAWGSFSPQMP